MLGIYKNNAYDIQSELLHKYPELDLEALIGSSRDTSKVDKVFNTYRLNLVFHAAADKYRVGNMILTSKDNAVNPTNIMGLLKGYVK